MADKVQGKIDIKIGNISFTAEGDQTWLSEQLKQVIEAAGKLPAAQPAPAAPGAAAAAKPPIGETLAAYIRSKGAENKQVLRFLATAGWLHRRGQEPLSSTSVAKALSQQQQKGLSNPADCLNQNAARGYCEKLEGKNFFITPEGWKKLGEEA